MPGRYKARYNWRDNLSQPRALPVETLDQTTARNLAIARASQFPLENEARQAQLARSVAAEAKSRYELSKQIETDRQRTAFYNGLQELESNLDQRGFPIGTREHAEAFAAYAHAVPLARSSKDVQDYLKLHAAIADDQAALTDRIKNAKSAVEAAGERPREFIIGQKGEVGVHTGQPMDARKAFDTELKGLNLNYQDFELGDWKPNVDKSGNTVSMFREITPANATSKSFVTLKPETYQRLQQTYNTLSQSNGAATPAPAVTPVATAAPDTTVATPPGATAAPEAKHLGRYNPQTGEFE